jgi:hypothetical protein
MTHGDPYLAQHPVGGDPRYAYLFGQAQGRDSALVRGHQVNGPKPLGQRKIGRVKQGARRQRGLVMTARTFVAVACADRVAMVMPTTWAAKAFRPALASQGFTARFFRAKALLPFQQINCQCFHDSTPHLIDHTALGRKY